MQGRNHAEGYMTAQVGVCAAT